MLKQILGEKQALQEELNDMRNQQIANAAAIAALQIRDAPKFSAKEKSTQPIGSIAGR